MKKYTILMALGIFLQSSNISAATSSTTASTTNWSGPVAFGTWCTTFNSAQLDGTSVCKFNQGTSAMNGKQNVFNTFQEQCTQYGGIYQTQGKSVGSHGNCSV